ncbi:hypothetical protein [Paenibacillus monticola]|uniref:Uncharacterized protein n=1 Tax=Paenibacillus monticola TaxID=2666075 RepID=A0A7X2HAL5_9BACL|nr:hypothetical protein [Paenibacillus monticola]MRN56446.1 hypothetical protein [Paenibacillus monticola]
MKNIKEISAFYYLCLITGYYSKQDIIEWADRCIAEFQFPYELIELSLSKGRSLNYIASILKSIYAKDVLNEPLYKLLGLLVQNLEDDQITNDDFFTYLNRILSEGSVFTINEELHHAIDRLDDGYYLATEGIYGDLDTLKDKAIEDLKKYKEYISIFEEA